MTVSEFQSLYLSEQPLLWLALAAVVGLIIGVFIGRWTRRSTTAKPDGKSDTSSKSSASEAPASDRAAFDEAGANVDSGTGFKEQALEAQDSSDVVNGEFQISHLVGMVDKQVQALSGHGITSVAELRDATSTKKARENLADELQLEDFVVNKWARMADFLRLDNMTPEVSEFLVFAGINSTKDLATRNPESVAHKLQDLNEKETRISITPTRQQLEAWVASLQD